MIQFTYQPSTVSNAQGFFGAVDIIIGSRVFNTRVIRVCRRDKAAALDDSAKLARAMLALGVNTPININDYL